MTSRYEIAQRHETCTQAFKSIGKEYDPKVWGCYNEDLEGRELCPFAASDTCMSKELP